jgi:hypothetical protein
MEEEHKWMYWRAPDEPDSGKMVYLHVWRRYLRPEFARSLLRRSTECATMFKQYQYYMLK